MSTEKKTDRPVVVTTKHRGIYFGYLVEELENGNAVQLRNMRHCFSYGVNETAKGTFGLAVGGPAKGSKIGPPVTSAKIRDVATLCECSPEATEAWEKANWS